MIHFTNHERINKVITREIFKKASFKRAIYIASC